jgi:hypothetical protein
MAWVPPAQDAELDTRLRNMLVRGPYTKLTKPFSQDAELDTRLRNMARKVN